MKLPAAGSRLSRFGLAAALFVIVIGSQWAAFHRYGSDMPNWDQWDAEGLHAIAPWYNQSGFLRELLLPHNEHRVILTKLQNLAVTIIGGQWDTRVESLFNAMLHASIAVGLWVLTRRILPAAFRAASFLLLAALFALPLSDENLLGGFHSQQYWLIGLSVAAIALMPFATVRDYRWHAGLAAALLALAAMGSGYLAAATIFLVVGWWCVRRQLSWREAWPALLATALIVGFGEATRLEVVHHQHMKAHSLHDFLLSALRQLAWPWRRPEWLAAVLWAPWLLLTARQLVRPTGAECRSPAQRGPWTLVALGGWVVAQILATAYARGAGAEFPAARYVGTLIIGIVVNGLALGWLISNPPAPLRRAGYRRPWLVGAAATGWLIVLGIGLFQHTTDTLTRPLPETKRYLIASENHVRAYLATNDPAELVDPIPFPNAPGLVARLAVPSLRELMPASVRPTLPLTGSDTAAFQRTWMSARTPVGPAGANLPPGSEPLIATPYWSSFTHGGAASTGEWKSALLAAPHHGWLRFKLAGTVDSARLTLRLHDAATGRELTEVRPEAAEKPGWQMVFVRAPRQAFTVVARDQDPQRWFAFSAPVEVSTLSLAALWLMQHGLTLAALGAAIAFLLAMPELVQRLRAGRSWLTHEDVPPASAAEPTASPLDRPRPLSRVAIGFVVFVFLAVWTPKLWTIARFGTDVPYWDQWAKEGELVFAPWLERHEHWGPLFLPHNEHRIVPTLALNVGLLRLGGDQWDARVQCVASAALHALIAAALAAWALRRLRFGWGIATALLLVLITAPPIAWDNVLGGFQSQFYFLIGFSFLAMGGMLSAPVGSWRWVGGILSVALAAISMGSGMLVAVPIAVVAAGRLLSFRGSGGEGRGLDATPTAFNRRDALLTLLAALILGAAGWWLRPHAEWHAPLHAHNLPQALLYAVRCLAWPLYEHAWLAVLLWCPWVLLAVSRVTGAVRRSRSAPTGAVADLVLAGGLWVLVQVAAVTYSRAGLPGAPASRYGDVFALGLVCNFVALAVLAAHIRAGVLWRPHLHGAVRVLAAFWLLTAVTAVAIATHTVRHGDLVQKRKDNRAYETNVQAFVLTDDYATFQTQRLPFPLADWLARIIRQPTLRRLLPASVREPLPLAGFSVNAVMPGAPPLTHRAIRVLNSPGEWRSATLPAGRGWWKFETAGDVGQPGASLRLVSARDGRDLGGIAPSKPAGNSWRAAYVRRSDEPAVLVARVDAPARWIAFSQPVEMSALSHGTWRLTQHAPLLGGFAFAGLFGFGAWLTLRRSARRAE